MSVRVGVKRFRGWNDGVVVTDPLGGSARRCELLANLQCNIQ